MHVDIGGALASSAAPGVSMDALERLDDDVARAHERIERGRADSEHGYAALDLPDTTDPDAIRSATARFDDVDSVLVAGIGGSALGAATLADALPTDAELYTMDNVDPATTRTLLDGLALDRTVLVGVSRSGTTAETLANFLVAREAIANAGVDWTDRTLVITGESGPLAKLADQHDLPRLAVPDGVPGRYSVLSAVGLAPAALAGIDIDAVLDGGRDGAAALSGSLFDCPAYAYGATSYALATRGVTVSSMMPYAEALETYAEWFAQLWAESLGKDGLGQVPVRALGATDQHSQLQLYRAGPRNVSVTLVHPAERPEFSIPEPDHEALSYLDGVGLGELLDAEREATAASLAAANRPSIGIEIERIDARSLGQLLYGTEAACVLAGELFGVNAFNQPAVEWGKRAARGLLRNEDTEETRTVRERTTHWIR